MGSSYEDLLPPVSGSNYSDLLPPMEDEEKRKNRFADLMPSFSGTGGVEEAISEPTEAPKPLRELGEVAKAGIFGGLRSAAELILFPARMAGNLGIAGAERTSTEDIIYPGQPPMGGEPDIPGYEESTRKFAEGFEVLKDAITGSSDTIKMVEEGASLPFEPISVAAQSAKEYAMDKTGDPLIATGAELGVLVGIFRAIPATKKGTEFAKKVADRIKEVRKEAKDLKEAVDEHVPFLDYGEGKRGPERRDTGTRLSDESYREMLEQEKARGEVKYDDLLPPTEEPTPPVETAPPIPAPPQAAPKPAEGKPSAQPTKTPKPKKGDRLLPAKLYLSPEEYRDQNVWQNNLQNFFTRDDKAVRWDKQVQELISQGVLPADANLDTLVKYIESYQKVRKEGVSASEFKAGYGDVTERKGAEYERKQAEHEVAQQEKFKPVKFEGNLLEEGDKFFYRGEEYEVMEKRESGVLIQDGNLEWVDNDGYFFADHGKIVRGGKEFDVREGVKYDDLLPPKEDQTQLPGVKADFKLTSEEAATTGEFRAPAAADQTLLPGTEKAYRDVGMGEKSVEQRLSEVVDSIIPEAAPAAGLSTKDASPTEPPAYTKDDYAFSDKVTETRYETAHGIKPVPFIERAREIIGRLKNKATREFEHLPRTAQFAEIRTALLKLAKQKGVVSDRTVRALQGITIGLDKTRMGLFERKILLDDLAGEVGKGRDLPFGFTPKSIAAERAKIDVLVSTDAKVAVALARRKEFTNEVKNAYIDAMEAIGLKVRDRFQNEDYYRHQVIEYANLKSIAGAGKRLRTPTGRGFLKERKGSELDINTNYLEAEYEVLAQMLHDIGIAKTIKVLDANYNIADSLKKQAGLYNENLRPGEKPIEWYQIIPKGNSLWQPREGNVFYLSDTVPAKLAEKLRSGALEEIGITEKDLRSVLTVGGPRRQFVLPNEIIETIENLSIKKSEGALLGLDRKVLGGWKVWQLISPRRFFKYNLRNLTGDAEAVFVGNPSAFKMVPQAVRELYQVFSVDRGMTPEMREWFSRGGFETTLQAQELHELNKFTPFKHIRDADKSITGLPVRVFKKYWEKATIATNFRESVLRYAAYLDYLEQMKADPQGLPKNYGASIPEEIRAISNIRDRAFALSNQLLGAYDQVSVMGNALRDHIYPFWSWKEVNFKRYIQFAKNAAADGKLTETVGRKAIGTAANPMTYVRVGGFIIKATAFWGMLQAWNNLMYPQEENEMNVNTRNRPHIILGRNKEGKIINFTNIGALGDFLAWFGLDAFPLHISNWAQGKRTFREVVTEMAQSPVNVVVQGTTPGIKLGSELLTGKRLFPDAFKPANIRDRGYHIAQSVGLENEYKALVGLPSEGYNKSMRGFFVYQSDPGQNAFSDIMNEKSRFLERRGKAGMGSFISPKPNALYNLRLSIKYNDADAAKKYLGEYEKLGGTKKGFWQSIGNMHPLSGLNDEEKIAFVASLGNEDREKLVRAVHFYTTILLGRGGQDNQKNVKEQETANYDDLLPPKK